MSKKVLVTIFIALAASVAMRLSAQTLRNTEWKSYGLQFKAPPGFVVEDDSEDGYVISTDVYYITLQLLEGNDIKRSELADELKHIAADDEVTVTSAVTDFELPQFYGVFLKGNSETDPCLYCYLLNKDEGSGFFLSIIYAKKEDKIPETILKSFKLVE